MTVSSKTPDQQTGIKVTYDQNCDISKTEYNVEMEPGTIVEVRDVFFGNVAYQKKFQANTKL